MAGGRGATTTAWGDGGTLDAAGGLLIAGTFAAEAVTALAGTDAIKGAGTALAGADAMAGSATDVASGNAGNAGAAGADSTAAGGGGVNGLVACSGKGAARSCCVATGRT